MVTLVSVYNHETDIKTLKQLSRYLQSMTTGLLMIGGDFYIVFNPFINKGNKNPFKRDERQPNPQKAALLCE